MNDNFVNISYRRKYCGSKELWGVFFLPSDSKRDWEIELFSTKQEAYAYYDSILPSEEVISASEDFRCAWDNDHKKDRQFFVKNGYCEVWYDDTGCDVSIYEIRELIVHDRTHRKNNGNF